MKLRKQQWENQDLTEHTRDVQRALDQVTAFEHRTLETTLSTNLVLRMTTQPKSIEVTRIQQMAAPSTIVDHGTAVSWDWRPDLGGALITRIHGMTLGTSVLYRTIFRITG